MSGAFETSGITDAVFWVVSVLAIGGAVLVVTMRNVFRAALFLAGTFMAVAGLYFMLSAEFVGAVQILVYVGAVSVLIVFALLTVRDVPGSARANRGFYLAVVVTMAVLVAVTVWFVAQNTEWRRIDDLEALNEDAAAALVGPYREKEWDRDNDGVRDQVTLEKPFPNETGNLRPGMLADSTGTIGELLVRDYVLPFQVVGMILVAALIGALVLVREERRR